MSRRPRPIAPVFQPEIAAEAILYATRSKQREVWIGSSSVTTIIADKFVARLLERYLAKTGSSGQPTPEPVACGRCDNVFDPAPGDPRTRGRFDREAAAFSPQLWASARRRWLAVGLSLAALVAAMVAGSPPLVRQKS